jgi:hypothetical protein
MLGAVACEANAARSDAKRRLAGGACPDTA